MKLRECHKAIWSRVHNEETSLNKMTILDLVDISYVYAGHLLNQQLIERKIHCIDSYRYTAADKLTDILIMLILALDPDWNRVQKYLAKPEENPIDSIHKVTSAVAFLMTDHYKNDTWIYDVMDILGYINAYPNIDLEHRLNERLDKIIALYK